MIYGVETKHRNIDWGERQGISEKTDRQQESVKKRKVQGQT